MITTGISDRTPVRLEARRNAATVYFREVLSARTVAQATALIDGLSMEVRSLRADLRDVRIFDPEAFARMAREFARWRQERNAALDVRFGERARASVWKRSPVVQLCVCAEG